METAYQKWEKRRQERTGGHRPALSHRRKKGSVALGINKDGQLLVEKEDGSQTAVYAGEVSVRGVYGYV